jgi:hypothetical protein
MAAGHPAPAGQYMGEGDAPGLARPRPEYRHSGIGLHTPASVHDGTAWAIQAQRQHVLD